MTLLSFSVGVAFGAMFMGFCFSRSMMKFANVLGKLVDRIEVIEKGMSERGRNE